MFIEYEKCELCPRKCGVDRRKAVGFCRVGAEPLVARASLHMWEEPCVSGKEGSGTVFFAGCTLGCVFCQNAEISRVNENRAGRRPADSAQRAATPRETARLTVKEAPETVPDAVPPREEARSAVKEAPENAPNTAIPRGTSHSAVNGTPNAVPPRKIAPQNESRRENVVRETVTSRGTENRETSIVTENSASAGKIVGAERLSEIFLELQEKGANNINLVTPTMFSPHIIAAVRAAREKGLRVPVLYNTGGYELPEIVEKLGGTVDIWMPDFKYLDPELSLKYSRAADYADFAKASLRKMVSLAPRAVYDERGMMRRGVIVRHLLLPGCLAESKRVLDYLFAEYGNDIVYSLMSQYTPTAALDREKFPSLARRVTTYEYDRLIDHALSLGITNAYTQYGNPAKESFIPSFDGTGV